MAAKVVNDQQHGNRGGGTLHANADGSTAGFMSTAIKTKLDSINSDQLDDDCVKITFQTADATPSVQDLYTIPDNCVADLWIEATAYGGSGFGGAGYVRQMTVKKVSGTPSTVGTAIPVTDRESNALMAFTLGRTGSVAQVTATGIAATNINWTVKAWVLLGTT